MVTYGLLWAPIHHYSRLPNIASKQSGCLPRRTGHGSPASRQERDAMLGSTSLSGTQSLFRCIGRPATPWVTENLRFPAAAAALRFAGVVAPSANRFKHVLRLLAQSGSGDGEPGVYITPQGNPKPHHVHTKLHFYPFHTGRLIIIGDVHGCAFELAQLLRGVKYDRSRDKLVFVGDLVNKGPHSLQVLRLVMTLGAAAVRGNHDDQALSAYHKFRRAKRENVPPHLQWVEAMRPEEAAFLRDLPFTLSVPSHRLLIVHAGLVPQRPKHRQHFLDMYQMRQVTHADDGYHACKPDKGEPWASKWEGPDHVIFGHDARRRLQKYPSCTGIDTGCVYGGSLTACIMPIVLPQALDENMNGAPTLELLNAKLLHFPAAKQYVQKK